jgi:hypothetical protein
MNATLTQTEVELRLPAVYMDSSCILELTMCPCSSILSFKLYSLSDELGLQLSSQIRSLFNHIWRFRGVSTSVTIHSPVFQFGDNSRLESLLLDAAGHVALSCPDGQLLKILQNWISWQLVEAHEVRKAILNRARSTHYRQKKFKEQFRFYLALCIILHWICVMLMLTNKVNAPMYVHFVMLNIQEAPVGFLLWPCNEI